MALTALAINAAKPKDKPYKLSDELGLCLLIMPTGGRDRTNLILGYFSEDCCIIEMFIAREYTNSQILFGGSMPEMVKNAPKRAISELI
ncbi:Arm DNA-binding domain-containing protein [Novosphingobium sp. SG707]|uniref:Arm DNA-binding domain-containing protein n=1 Tax=Novosphingobium sp. SG707 TaxID=2586996 RepID=UPI0014464917|nr:Arm DNA-binding domain-containing protein [Novosphingobium sp. SG707]NKJ02962.1 hypothetical protein [Novosphingobium sp. SG707]